MDYDVLILFSGGADSIYCSEIARQFNYNIFYLMIDYNQLHIEELICAKNYLKNIDKLQHSQTVKIDNLNIKSGLTTGDKYMYGNVHNMYVPSRNMMFVSVAASIAENKKISLIWYGADLSDNENSFPDCTQEWVIRMNHLLRINGSFPLKLESPTLGLTKKTIFKMIKNTYDIDDSTMYSGYREFS